MTQRSVFSGNGGEGKALSKEGHQSTFKLMETFYIMIIIENTNYIFLNTHQNAQLKLVNITVYKVYLNKAGFKNTKIYIL